MVLKRKHIDSFLVLLLVAASTSFIHAQVVVSPGSAITIKQGSKIYIDDDILLKSDATSSGYFVDQTVNGDNTITGNKTVQRYFTSNGWHNTASPVSGETSDVYVGTDLIFYYNETIIQNDWNFGWVMYQGALNVMKGYDVFLPGVAITVLSYSASQFQSLNTGLYTIDITRTNVANGEVESRKGWNLIGNPYPSPVDWLTGSGWDKTDINDAKYIWDPVNDNYTIFLGGAFPIGINGGTQFIPSNQGFWVQATHNGSVQVNNTCRVGSTPATPDYYKKASFTYPLLFVEVSANGYKDQTLVRFLEGTSDDFDLNYDAVKLYSGSALVPQVSFQAGKSNLAVNTLPKVKDGLELTMNFKCGTSGFYSIKLNTMSNLDPYVVLYLKDELTHGMINLSKDSTYNFFHDPTDTKSRFKLLFNPSYDIINNITQENTFSVFAVKNMITIVKNSHDEVSGNISIYNFCGQKVLSRQLTNDYHSEFSLNVQTGYYIVCITSNNHTSNFKILINN